MGLGGGLCMVGGGGVGSGLCPVVVAGVRQFGGSEGMDRAAVVGGGVVVFGGLVFRKFGVDEGSCRV